MRARLLAAAAIASLIGGLACTGPGSGGTGFVHGIVHTGAGSPIASALVSLGSATSNSVADGSFSLSAVPGTHPLTVSASGYRTLHSNVVVAAGNANALDLTLVLCTPGVDAGCGTPTPVPTALPTPSTVNVRATFNGVNMPSPGAISPWTGQADLDDGTTRSIGRHAQEPGEEAWSECWKSADENTPTVSTDARSAIDHCWIVWWGGGVAFNDAWFIVFVDGSLWNDGAVIDTTVDPANAAIGYYEGDAGSAGAYGVASPPNTANLFLLRQNGTGGITQNQGIFRLQSAGYYAGQPAVLTSGYFFIQNLP